MFISGDLVKLRNGKLGYVMDSYFGDLIILKDGGIIKESAYNEDCKNQIPDLDIVEIREPRTIYDYDLKHFDNCPKLWSENSGI